MPSQSFPYDLAFDRNLGWLTDWEQLALRSKHVAIAGMGGVGGTYLLTLARLGIGGFTIADLDHFEYANFNRQVGATMATVGRSKTEVLEEMALAINPELRIRRFDSGVAADGIDDFLRGADLFIDGFDFFELSLRRQVFARCRTLGIPAITAAPIGMGVAYLAFQPNGMSFEEYFRMEGRPEQEQYLRFLLGLTPRPLHRNYLVDSTRVDLQRRKGPSTIAAIQLCAGVTAVAAVKLLLRRGDVMAAPWNHQFDPYRGRFTATRLRFGNAGPLQRLKIAVGRRLYGSLAMRPAVPETPAATRQPLEEILNLARWAPSGDNSQPWRFSILDDQTLLVRPLHSQGNVYEYRDGEPTSLSVGMLLELIRIAATAWQRDATIEQGTGEHSDHLVVRLPPAPGIPTDPLASLLTLRSVDRSSYRRRALTPAEKAELTNCLPPGLAIDWYEGTSALLRVGILSGVATQIRLRCPEAFPVHQRMIDWEHPLSPSGIPAQATGLSPAILPVMRWSMQRWSRAQLLNHLGGSLASALQLDYLPALRSGAYFVLRRTAEASSPPAPDGLFEIGRGLQRFWLSATRLGLSMQPNLALLAFAHYGEQKIQFSRDAKLNRKAEALAERFQHTFAHPPRDVVFLGRIGESRPRIQKYRSSRRPLPELMEPGLG